MTNRTPNPGRGGPRPGAGRPPIDPSLVRVTISFRALPITLERLAAIRKRTGLNLGAWVEQRAASES